MVILDYLLQHLPTQAHMHLLLLLVVRQAASRMDLHFRKDLGSLNVIIWCRVLLVQCHPKLLSMQLEQVQFYGHTQLSASAPAYAGPYVSLTASLAPSNSIQNEFWC